MPKLRSLILTTIAMTIGMSSIARSQPPVEKFRVVGTEPFWTLKIDRQGFFYSNPEGQRNISAYIRPLTAQNRSADSLRVYRLPKNNTLIIQKATCIEGDTYPYTATLIIDRQVLSGCAQSE
jgi:uncharacterized membrane protein